MPSATDKYRVGTLDAMGTEIGELEPSCFRGTVTNLAKNGGAGYVNLRRKTTWKQLKVGREEEGSS